MDTMPSNILGEYLRGTAASVAVLFLPAGGIYKNE
jgi:hypothetical protein